MPKKKEGMTKLAIVSESLKQYDVQSEVQVNPHLHDREIRLSTGWTVKIGRGFDIYQRPDDWLNIGANDLDLRPCLETTVDIYPNAHATSGDAKGQAAKTGNLMSSNHAS